MSKGTDKPQNAPEPPDDQEDEGYATAEDLFGDLVDAPTPPEAGRSRKGAGRVRVQLADPVSPEPLAPPVSEEDGGLEAPHGPVLEGSGAQS